jgi:quaternary ammonium compound-resistance protein SugE
MAWLFLLVAGLLEIVWASMMKLSQGSNRGWPGAIMVVAMLLSFGALSVSMRTLPLGTAYAVWTGIGAVGAFMVGVLALGEPLTARRALAAVLIMAGMILMKTSSPERR